MLICETTESGTAARWALTALRHYDAPVRLRPNVFSGDEMRKTDARCRQAERSVQGFETVLATWEENKVSVLARSHLAEITEFEWIYS